MPSVGSNNLPKVHNIILDTEKGEEIRKERLRYVVGYIYAEDFNAYQKIHSLLDREGTLTVTWLSVPIDEEMIAIENAWASELCNENPECVEHCLIKRGDLYD